MKYEHGTLQRNGKGIQVHYGGIVAMPVVVREWEDETKAACKYSGGKKRSSVPDCSSRREQ